MTEQLIKKIIDTSKSRSNLWVNFINEVKVNSMAEIGVYRGDFAKGILKECPSITKYYMLDPWRNLEDWNKPANKCNDVFKQYLEETKEKTDFADSKRIILRGKTTEVIDEMQDESLDFIYIDGDHTLKGITIDLINAYTKVRNGGWLGGDDFSRTIWQHQLKFEPTLVFPFAVYFAEAVGKRIYALPFDQFLIEKSVNQPFDFIDLTGKYPDITLNNQLSPKTYFKVKIKNLIRKLLK